jgi:hypothetical protein
VKHSNIICRYSKVYHLSEITVAFINYGADKGPTHTTMWRPVGQRALSRYRILKFLASSFRLDSIILTEGSILEDLGVTSPIITVSLDYWVTEGRGEGKCTTNYLGYCCQLLAMRFPTISRGSYLDVL